MAPSKTKEDGGVGVSLKDGSSACRNNPDAYTIKSLNVTYIDSPPSFRVTQEDHPYQICTKYFSSLLRLPGAFAYTITSSDETDIEYYYDRVIIHEGADDGPILRWTSFSYEAAVDVGTPQGIVIEFSSDYSITHYGINLTVDLLPTDRFPQQSLLDDGSYLIETNHPYRNFEILSTPIFNFPTGNYHLAFDDLHSTESNYDFMRVYAGNGSESDSLLYSRSGVEGSWPDVTVASTVGISILFVSDLSITTYGLKFIITSVESVSDSVYRDNIYLYDDMVYSTLADVQVDSYSSGNDQSYYIQLPDGWQLAQDEPTDLNIRTVISHFYWDTDVMVLANGNAIHTKAHYNKGNEVVQETAALITKPGTNSTYKCKQDNYICQIMIVQSDSICGPYTTQEERVLHSAMHSLTSADVWSPHPINHCSDYSSSVIEFPDTVAYLIQFDQNTSINDQDRLNVYEGIEGNAQLLFSQGGGKYDATGNLNWVRHQLQFLHFRYLSP